MPTYEYECKSCGHLFEKFQSITASPSRVCPKCGGKVRRLIGKGSAVIFKGSGFYATDYRSEEYKKKAKEERTENKKEEKGAKVENSSSSKERKDSLSKKGKNSS